VYAFVDESERPGRYIWAAGAGGDWRRRVADRIEREVAIDP